MILTLQILIYWILYFESIMTAKKRTSQRKRSRPIEKRSKLRAVKGSKLGVGVILVVIAIVVIAAIYLYSAQSANAIPVAGKDFSVITKNSSNNVIDVLKNDIDNDGDELNITDITLPSHGSINIVGVNIHYTPSSNYSGLDSFEYTISDGRGGVTTGEVHVIVAEKKPISDENPIALMDTSRGMIIIELYEDKAPNTVENFIKLTNNGFYSGLVFHRVANLDPSAPDTHVIQGGGFNANGDPKESPYGSIDLEIHPDLVHDDGALAMARTTDPNSATSQFYICDGPQHFLDGNYAVFGKVIDGMAVIRAIASVDTTTKHGTQNWPVEDVIINSITIENQ